MIGGNEMLREYPNIGLLEYVFQEKLCKMHDPSKTFIPDDDVYMFPQVWPNTGDGFAQAGYFYGDCMTKEYTTVIVNNNDNAAMVAFGNKCAYIVKPMTEKFIDDLRHHRMAGWKEKERYKEEGDNNGADD